MTYTITVNIPINTIKLTDLFKQECQTHYWIRDIVK